jgi:hypothetical protein
MYLSEPEEIVAYVVCIAIIIGFAVTTYMEIKNTVYEEKQKHKEEKIKTLISYFNAKKKLIDTVAKLNQTKKDEKSEN